MKPHTAGVIQPGSETLTRCTSSTVPMPATIEARADAVEARGMNSPASTGTNSPTPISV
jgi:hypothetical protein